MSSRLDQPRIVFTGNIARFNPNHPGRSNQNQNINWLRHIVAPHLERLLDRPMADVQWREGDNNLYAALGLAPTMEAYLEIYLGGYNDRLGDLLLPQFDGALVVGFETPPFLLQLFDANDIPYIDVILGPLRFFPDLVPAVRSNVPEVAAALARQCLEEGQIRAIAAWRQAFFAKQALPAYPAGTTLLVGQTNFDTSQVSNGGFVDLTHFEAEVSALAQQGNVLFKPHPYVTKRDRREQLAMIGRHGIEVNEDNVYRLLNSAGIDSVVAISSSVCVEAPYFGCAARTLIDYPFPFATAPGETGSFYNVWDKLATTAFWAALLDRECTGSYSLPPGSLAQSLGQSWGADAFAPTTSRPRRGLLQRLLRR